MTARRLCRVLAIMLTTCGVTGCRSDSKQTPPPRTDTPAEKAEPPKATASTLRIDQEMLRDLRITTSKVEQHRGGESSSLLGELGVNQNAYAKVSSPLPARVVLLRAVEGQRVRTGDILATGSGRLARCAGRRDAQARRDLRSGPRPQARFERGGIVPTRGAGSRTRVDCGRSGACRPSVIRALRAPDRASRGPARQRSCFGRL